MSAIERFPYKALKHSMSIARLLVLFTSLLLPALAAAQSSQLRVRINLPARPDPYISTWANSTTALVVTVTNSSTQSFQARFDCQISLDGVPQASTNPTRMPTFTVHPGTAMYFARDVIPQQAVTFHTDVDRVTARTGMLKAGNYSVCVSLLDASTLQRVSEQACRPLYLTSYQAPVLIQPEDKIDLATNQRPMFRWIGVIPRPPSQVFYRVEVFEILRGQNVTRAFMVNKPILDRKVTSTQLLWPPDVELPREGMDYAWCVIATDALGNTIGEPKGLGGPWSFRTRPKLVTTRENALPKSDITQKDSLKSGFAFGLDSSGGFIPPSLSQSDTEGRSTTKFEKVSRGNVFEFDEYRTDSMNKMVEGSRHTVKTVVLRTDAKYAGKTDVVEIENSTQVEGVTTKDTAHFKYEANNNISVALLISRTDEPPLVLWMTLPVATGGAFTGSTQDSIHLMSGEIEHRMLAVSVAPIGKADVLVNGKTIATRKLRVLSRSTQEVDTEPRVSESILYYAPEIGYLAKIVVSPKHDPFSGFTPGSIRSLLKYEVR